MGMNLITFLGYVGLVTSFIYLYLEFRQRDRKSVV